MLKLILGLSFLVSIYTSCAPVKFAKADSHSVEVNCSSDSCSQSPNSIVCDPKINNNVSTYTYVGAANPGITSNCNLDGASYDWVVKKPDSTVITSSLVAMTGANPSNIDFTALGVGTYYVFLNASKTSSGWSDFHSATPLEFVVPGAKLVVH